MASRDKDREQDKPAAELLRRSLASPAGAPGLDVDPCPDPEILAAYFERSLDADETARYELHFSRCARCREMLAAMVHAGEPAGAAGEKRARSSSTAWAWDWRWLAPIAATVIVLAAIWVMRGPALSHRTALESGPMVASSQSPEPAPPESSRAASNSASGVPAASGALQRTAPNLDSTKSESAPPAKPAPPSRDETKEFGANLPLSGRNYEQLDALKKSAVAPKTGDSDVSGSSAANGVAIPSSAETVTVENATQPITPAASPPAATPVPPEISAGNVAGAAAPAPGAASERARNLQTVVVTANRGLAMSESVTVESADDRNPRTLVHSPDPDVLWRISSGRFVERSSDAGSTWRVQWTNANAHVVAGAAPSVETCWLVGRNGIILLTTDGKKWRTIAPPADADFVDVAATDASSATVTTTDDRKFTTTDGGKRWTPAP
ncbi:MAG: hypothetical protein WB949_12940 [Candidatus Acidiferrales bacterium]